jgi:hypothetical protein
MLIFLFFQTVEAGDVCVVKIVAPPGVNFNNKDTLPFINAKVKNFSCNPETLSDTFRIGNGIARLTERVILAPEEERLLTFVNWVRDRIYPQSFVSETTREFPTVVLSQIKETYPMGYVVYTARPPFSNSNYLYFAAFDNQIDTACYYKIALDTGEIQNGGAIYTPSIAITPGDYLHVVWCKEGKVWYKTTLQPVHPDLIRAGIQPVWSKKVLISTQEPMTEPASNPFVEASGEWVYCVWRGPNEEGNPNYGEIWQRKGRIRRDSLPYWYPPRNISKSPLRESNYPTMSTGNAVVWQELLPDSNFEIYAK